MRIAILGTRGVPARYGGFETFAAELSARLAGRGHEVSVYCRRYLYPDKIAVDKGISRIELFALRSKHLETLSHTFLSICHVLWQKIRHPKSAPQVVIICNAANAPLIPLLRVAGVPVLLNVDGIERKRGKWGSLGALWYLLGERCATKFATQIISDANVIREYYLNKYRVQSEVIAYGCDQSRDGDVSDRLSGLPIRTGSSILEKFDLQPNKYILYVSRLEPENNAYIVVEAFAKAQAAIGREFDLVVVGNAPYADNYIMSLRGIAAPQTKFLGFQFGETYKALMMSAALYIQATEVGGTHPALVEAMGFGNCVIANNTPENAEVLEGVGILYEMNNSRELCRHITELLRDTEQRKRLASSARRRALERYSWDKITTAYETLFEKIVAK